jgi:heme-degrading monooxygenase HmoA
VHARVNVMEMDPGRIDDAVKTLEEGGLDRLKSIDGFKGMTILGDRGGGKALAISFWESEDALNASEESVRETRKQATEAAGAPEPKIEIYEVVLDTMA